MDRREAMPLSNSAPYYLNRGPVTGSAPRGPGLPLPPGFELLASSTPNPSPNIPLHQNVRVPSFQNPSPPNYADSVDPAAAIPAAVKKKRGRPRKYGPDATNMALALSPMSSAISPGGLNTPDLPKRSKGRPRGSGRKQQLAALGEWMNNSAGLAFTPHVIHVAAGEDVAANIYSFAQQRPRALCILSASGTVSAVTLRQPTSSDDEAAATYEGRFEILCLSGSYLVAENGGPRNRTGGLSISICSQDGHVLGGAVGGKLIASNPVQVIACSFVYGGAKPKTDSKPEKKEVVVAGEKSTLTPPTSVDPSQIQSQNPNLGSSVVAWPLGSTNSRPESRDPHRDIDLTRG